MDLKSGTLFWPRRTRKHSGGRTLRRNLQCDVVVIGAGLTGAMVAHALGREGLDVVILEKRDVGQGSTSASTALLLYEVDTHLCDLAQQRGWTAAARSYRRCLTAIDELAALVRQLRDSCGFRRRPSLYVASQAGDLKSLKREFAARKRAGFDVALLSAAEIRTHFSFSAAGAIYSRAAAEVDPFRLAALLIQESVRAGARLFVHTRAARVTEGRRGVTIRTASGNAVAARWAVIAAGFETTAREARRVVKLKSTYAMVTRPVSTFSGWHERCLIWETKRPYIYLRTTSDDRILVGGEDEDFVNAGKRDALIGDKGRALHRKLRQMFPDIPTELSSSWAGTFGETKDGLPYIGPLKARSRVLHALCYGANGTNFAAIAADIIRDTILGKRNDHAELFGFKR